MSKAYSIMLSEAELSTLAWCSARGYFPSETYAGLACDEDTDDDPPELEREWYLEEHEAWPITDLREDDPDACFACIGDPLLSKLLKLEESIV